MKYEAIQLLRPEWLPTLADENVYEWGYVDETYPIITSESYAREQMAEHIGRHIPGNY